MTNCNFQLSIHPPFIGRRICFLDDLAAMQKKDMEKERCGQRNPKEPTIDDQLVHMKPFFFRAIQPIYLMDSQIE